ncbi:MAG: hypothetical protein AAGA75_08370 [Cyanobacteria bacterium P01_E01_bin.6]
MNTAIHTPTRTSPVDRQLKTISGNWREVYGMSALAAVSSVTGNEATAANPLAIADFSCLPQWGVKGSGAADWLAQHNIPVPETSNTWCNHANGGMVARLGMTEFAIQLGWDPPALPSFPLIQEGASAYPVERQYLAIALRGAALPTLLRQTCNVDFQALPITTHPVVMTMMIGVSVTVLPGEQNGSPFYQVWGDRSYGPYLWQTLVGIAEELGGGVVGIDQIR